MMIVRCLDVQPLDCRYPCRTADPPGNPGANSAPGTMQHLALKVRDKAALLAIRDRLREKGVPVLGPIDHGMCASIYFAGLENVVEVAYSEESIDPQAWIDQVVSLLNISDSELESFISPPDYLDRNGTVKQPTLDSDAGPHMSNTPMGLRK